MGAMTEKMKYTTEAGGALYRCKVHDTTGVHFVVINGFQPDAMAQLASIQVENLPCFVSVVGKPSIYHDERSLAGLQSVSVRAELITVVEKEERNQWIVEASMALLKRMAVRPPFSADSHTSKTDPRIWFSDSRIQNIIVRALENVIA